MRWLRLLLALRVLFAGIVWAFRAVRRAWPGWSRPRVDLSKPISKGTKGGS
ncbi:MAG: hypothetical protein BWZ10_00055 [candidate division BRC1 bacterium ADurb.BinA364]|nr:MAG: hypothetical protein BWZ10_00055 [candidate division BRC1 bacterium ADurb.BinA364]